MTNLLVNPVYVFTMDTMICSGDSILLPGGYFVDSTGIYVDSLTTQDNCDSIITTNVFVNPSYQFTVYDTICGNEFITLPGGGTADTTGIYVDSFMTQSGCDSIVVTDLLVYPDYKFDDTLYVCDGDSILMPGGYYVSTAGVYFCLLYTSPSPRD